MLNREIAFFLILLGFPVIVGGGVVLITFLARNASLRTCPYCSRRVSIDAFSEGLPCPECGCAVAGSSAIAAVALDHPPLCTLCGTKSNCIELWDAQWYCKACISRESPALLSSIGLSRLVEDMPCPVAKTAFRVFMLSVLVVFGLASIPVLAIAIVENWQRALVSLGVLFVIGSPVIVLWTVAGAVAMPLARQRVIAWQGRIIVRLGTRLIHAPLEACKWRSGIQSDASVPRMSGVLRGRTLIIQLPEGNRIAVGFNCRTYNIWRAFFELARVSQAAKPNDLHGKVGRER